VEERQRLVSALPQARLTEDDRLVHPVNAVAPGRVGMREVPWPAEWNRAYFTPVTLLGDQAAVGRTITATRAKSILDAELVERVNKQILTFSWPAGASSVLVYIGPPGGSPQQARQSQPEEINRQNWEQYGGLTFRYPLPSGGCRLHLVPVAFNAGQRIEGAVTSIDYQWLLRIRYQLQIRRNLMRRPVSAIFSMSTDLDSDSPPFVLVHNPARLPLDYRDGTVLPVVVDGDQNSQPTMRAQLQRLSPESGAIRFRAEIGGLTTGYLRLFVDLPAEVLAHVALLDPSADDLSLRS